MNRGKKRHDPPRGTSIASSISGKSHFAKMSSYNESIDTQLEANNEIGIMDLPPEIRNRIYFFTLKTEDGIRITRHRVMVKKKIPREWLILDAQMDLGKKVIGYTVKGTTRVEDGKKSKKLQVNAIHLLNVLCVSKAFNTEAGPIAYGANRFIFETGYALSVFKKKVGRNFALLKDIKIEGLKTQQPHLLFQDLAALKAPTRIAVPNQWYKGYGEVETYATTIMAEILPFVMNRVEWGSRAKFQPGFHKVSSIEARDARRKRLESLFIHGTEPSRKMHITLGKHSFIKNEQHGNALFKSALIEIWENFIDGKQKYHSTSRDGLLLVFDVREMTVQARKYNGFWVGTALHKR